MLQPVQPGDKILASQYNELMEAVKGPNTPTTTSPFTQTKNGTVLNGGMSYQMRLPVGYNGLFNIASGVGPVDQTIFTQSTTSEFNGVWVQLAGRDAANSRNYLYHDKYFNELTHILLIDPFTEDDGTPHLIKYPDGISNGYDARWALCELSASAGIAVFQMFYDNAPTDTDNGVCVLVIGNFRKFGAQTGYCPDIDTYTPGQGGAFDDYKTYINSALNKEWDSIALRHTVPVYIGESALGYFAKRPVAYTIGQQHIETVPDGNCAYSSIDKDIYLSSLEFTPASQMNMQLIRPTFSSSLYNFHKKDCDYATLDELKEAEPLSTEMKGLSAFDILLRHKDKHPNDSGPATNNAMARLEYIPLSAIIGGTVDSKLSSLQLSSIAELTDIDPNTQEETKYHQLYGFDAVGMGTFSLSDQNEFDIVVREWHTTGGNGARVNYVKLSAFVDSVRDGLSVKVDSRDGGLSSIGYDEADRLELYNFSQGQRVQKNDKFDIVVRDNQNGKVDYTPLSALGSGYPGPWEITINEQTGDATFTNCVAKVARAYHFFQDQSANVGGGDKMVYFVMTHATSPSVHMYVGNYSSAASLLGGTDANCISASITPLYRITDNKVTCDYRYMLNIQAYDNRNFSTTMYY